MVSTAKSVEYTLPALRSFRQFTSLGPSDEFHLIDNDKGALDAALIAKDFPWVIFTSLDAPRSFAENMNTILRRADELKGDALLLNNDLVFAPNWLPPLEAEERWVLSSVSNMHFHHKTAALQLKLTMSLSEVAGKEREFLAIVKTHQETYSGYQLAMTFPYYCTRIPRAVYGEVGYFDETYSKAGFEDADYTVRCWNVGIPLYFALKSFVLHFYGKSSWTADGGVEAVHPDPKIGRRGEMLFRKRYGDEATLMFAIQNEEGQLLQKQYTDKATRDCFSRLAREARERMKTIANPNEPD